MDSSLRSVLSGEFLLPAPYFLTPAPAPVPGTLPAPSGVGAGAGAGVWKRGTAPLRDAKNGPISSQYPSIDTHEVTSQRVSSLESLNICFVPG